MRYLDEFRDPAVVPGLRARLARAAARLDGPRSLMEVCGTHTMAIARHGIRELLPPGLRLVSGPGCPVCVTPTDYVDHALALARLPNTLLTTFGDMVRVPGTRGSLATAGAEGAAVEVVLSALDALRMAQAQPGREVIFLAVGFETTAPTVAATLQTAAAAGVRNFSILCAHKTIPVALDWLATAAQARLHGLLCPPHVSAIIGTRPYAALAARGIPCVVGGFEPLDILLALAMLVEQLAAGVARVENEYGRVVSVEGNRRAQAVLARCFEPGDAVWRGLGMLPGSGLRLREEWAAFDAARRFAVSVPLAREPEGCRCGEILTGEIDPEACPLFGARCTPEDPIGACMVSSEGTCAARHRYGVPS